MYLYLYLICNSLHATRGRGGIISGHSDHDRVHWEGREQFFFFLLCIIIIPRSQSPSSCFHPPPSSSSQALPCAGPAGLTTHPDSDPPGTCRAPPCCTGQISWHPLQTKKESKPPALPTTQPPLPLPLPTPPPLTQPQWRLLHPPPASAFSPVPMSSSVSPPVLPGSSGSFLTPPSRWASSGRSRRTH